MYSPGVEDALRNRSATAGVDLDAVNWIVRVGKRMDTPATLGDIWANQWDGIELAHFANLSQAERQDTLAGLADAFLQDTSNRLTRASYAASQTADPDLQWAGRAAVAVQDVLISFGRDVLVRGMSPRTGKVKFRILTDVDVETTRAIIEVTTQASARGKVGQLGILVGPAANPQGKLVFHLMPHVAPSSAAAQSLIHAGAAGVFDDMATMVAAIKAL